MLSANLQTSVKNGRLGEGGNETLRANIAMFEGKEVEICIVEKVKTRSNQQNTYYWGVVIKIALSYYEKNVGDLIRDMMAAMKFSLTKNFVHELFKILFGDGESTRDKETTTMTEYWDKIRHHFFHEYQVDIPEPGQEVMEGFEIKKENENVK